MDFNIPPFLHFGNMRILLTVTVSILLSGFLARSGSPRLAQPPRMDKPMKTPAITHHYAEVNGVRLHYARAGTGKKLILFVHGFPEFWYAYKNQLEAFGTDYTAIAPDMRGFNLSDKPTEEAQYQIRYMVEDLRQLAEKLGYKKFTLVAHDWGGVIAWVFGMAHPEYLDKLIIVNAPHPAIFKRELLGNPEQQKNSQYMLLFRSPQAEAAIAADNYKLLYDAVLAKGLKDGYFNEADIKAYRDAWAQPGAMTGGLNYYRASKLSPPAPNTTTLEFEYGFADNKSQVNVPTLVIWGEQDGILTTNLVGLDQYVPQLTIKRIPDGSHWVIHEKPELVNQYIREFVR